MSVGTWYGAAGVRTWDLVSTATGDYGKLDLQDGAAVLTADLAFDGPSGGGCNILYRRNGSVNLSLFQTADSPGDFALATSSDSGTFQEIPFRVRRGDGKLFVKSLNLSGLPTSVTGLTSGDVWRDAANDNVLKIVP